MKIIIIPSTAPTSIKGAHGPTWSKRMPPTITKVVVPTDPKKKAIPVIVPRIVLCIFLINMTSTDKNCITDVMTKRTQITYASKSLGFSMDLKDAATIPLLRKAKGIT